MQAETLLNDMKLVMGIARTETDMNDILILELETAIDRLKAKLGGNEPGTALKRAVISAAVSQFNRRGNEGMKGVTIEGETISYADTDWYGYEDEIAAYRDSLNTVQKGKVKFL